MARNAAAGRFRHNGAIVIVVVLAAIGALPLALSSWYLAPILLLPVLVGLWAVRSGVDASSDGIDVHGALGSRRLAWSEVTGFRAAGNQVAALLANGRAVVLPAVRPTDVPLLVEA